MKIAILSRNSKLYSTNRLYQAAAERGHQVEIIDYLRCYMNITSKKPTINYQSRALESFDAVIPRIGAKRTFYGTGIVRQLETTGTYCINSSIAITRARDKLRSLQLLAMKGIGMPITGFAHDHSDLQDLIQAVGDVPVVIKLIEGTQGTGVVLAESRKSANSMIQAFMGLHANIIVQEFIKESQGKDIRCLVVGREVIASMERKAASGDFRSNLHCGGTAEPIKITKLERETAIKATKAMGLRLAGVDLLRSDRGPLVLEVNSSPGLEGIEQATSVDVAGKIIEYIEKNAKPISQERYQG